MTIQWNIIWYVWAEYVLRNNHGFVTVNEGRARYNTTYESNLFKFNSVDRESKSSW